jgi:7-cyano-7-deazaguanine synthase in queuosine biosynthesis
MVARIEIELREPQKRGKFDDVIIHLYKENERYSTNINFDFTPLYSFARDKESVAFDFLFFSVLIYNIDRFVNRHIFSLEGWTREINIINMPVIHIDEFQHVKTQMDAAISFLTGDIWDINYCGSEGSLYQAKEDIKNWGDVSVFEKVCLFSGGLDSLIGAIDELETMPQQKKLLLISHKDLGKEGIDQNSIISIFSQQHFYDNRYAQIQTSVGIGKKDMGERIARESTFRSRSLLFIGMGVYAAYKIGQDTSLIIPENGTIALNIPLMPSRRSACSTRTTHPTFMNRLQGILFEIGITNQMYNPCELKTKGEMVADSRNPDTLQQLVNASCSCAKRSHTHYWDTRGRNIKHCGMCLPCIYRRVSLHMNGIDDARQYGTDVFNGQRFDVENLSQKSPRDFRTLLEFLRRRPSIERIEKELLINGMCEVSRISEYAHVVDRTLDQIMDWIRASGNNNIMRKAGMR